MAESKKKSSEEDFGGTVALGLVGLGLVFLIAIPTVLGYLTFAVARAYLGRRENAALVVVGVGGLAWKASYCFHSYGSWLGDIVNGELSLGGVPWLPLLLMTLVVAGILGLLAGTSAVDKFGRELRPGTVVKGGNVRGGRAGGKGA